MRLAVSNIAWDAQEETAVAEVLRGLDVRSVEIAPTKVFPVPTATTASERAAYLDFWGGYGVEIVAFQSMLFGRPDLQVFGDAGIRAEAADVLCRFIELAGALGAGRLVFGSPKNRVVPDGMTAREAQEVAVRFFTRLAGVAQDNNTLFCIEPNPTDYACNFVTTASEGLQLVSDVGHPGFALHLDAAGMTLAQDDIQHAIRSAGTSLAHFHASAPNLGPLEDVIVDHAQAFAALKEIGYQGHVSIEMRPGPAGRAAADVATAVTLVSELYGS